MDGLYAGRLEGDSGTPLLYTTNLCWIRCAVCRYVEPGVSFSTVVGLDDWIRCRYASLDAGAQHGAPHQHKYSLRLQGSSDRAVMS